MNKADWQSFKALCESEINETILNANDPIDNFTTILYKIADKTISKTSTKTKKKKKPWFNDDCKTSIHKRRQALQQFNTRQMHQNLKNFRVFRTFRDSKRKSWKQYVSKLNSRTSVKKVWDMVRKIQGRGKSASVNHLKKNNTHVKASENYSAKFRKIKDQQEKQKLKFTSDNTESYNSNFSLTELTDAISKAHDSSPGPDDIHYQLLNIFLLLLFRSFLKFITVFGQLTIITIPKPDKDHTDPSNYRPIALTSCVCKTWSE